MANVERSYCGRVERGESQPTLFVVLKVTAVLEMEGHALVRQVEHALARTRLGGASRARRSRPA